MTAALERCRSIRDATGHGAGWVTIHQTSSVCYVFANWWCDDSIVKRRGWVAPGAAAAELRAVTDAVTACVWEISVEAFERDLWVATAMASTSGVSAYLREALPPISSDPSAL